MKLKNCYVKREKAYLTHKFILKTFGGKDLCCKTTMNEPYIPIRYGGREGREGHGDDDKHASTFFVKNKSGKVLHLIENNFYIGSVLCSGNSVMFIFSNAPKPIQNTVWFWQYGMYFNLLNRHNQRLKSKEPDNIKKKGYLTFYQSGGIGSVKNYQIMDLSNELVYECLRQNKSTFNILCKKTLSPQWCLAGVVAACCFK